MDTKSWTVRYTGGPILARLAGQTLEENGIEIHWEKPPIEERGGVDMGPFVYTLIATGAVDAMKAAFVAARARATARGMLEIDPPLNGEDESVWRLDAKTETCWHIVSFADARRALCGEAVLLRGESYRASRDRSLEPHCGKCLRLAIDGAP